MFLDFLDFPVATVHRSDITKSEEEVSGSGGKHILPFEFRRVGLLNRTVNEGY